LEPGADRAAPVVEPERRIREERQAARLAVELRGSDLARGDLRGDRCRCHVSEHSAAPESAFKVSLNQRSPSPFHILLKGRPRNRSLSLLDPERAPADS